RSIAPRSTCGRALPALRVEPSALRHAQVPRTARRGRRDGEPTPGGDTLDFQVDHLRYLGRRECIPLSDRVAVARRRERAADPGPDHHRGPEAVMRLDD